MDNQDIKNKQILNQFDNVLNGLNATFLSLNTHNILILKLFTEKDIALIESLIKSICTCLNNSITTFFRYHDNSVYRLSYMIDSKTIIDHLVEFKSDIDLAYKNIDTNFPTFLSDKMLDLIKLEYKYKLDIDSAELHDEIQKRVEKKINKTFEGIERAKLAFENDKITIAYEKIYQDLDLSASCYQIAFWGALVIGGLCAAISINQYPNIEDGNFWFSKILIFSLTITFATFFVRRSSHLRKQSDQLKREAWEMDALPIFISSLDEHSQSEVIKDLVPKYFGKEIDQSINNKMADFVNEQIKTSLEVFKTSTDIVKSLKPSVVKDINSNKAEKND